MRLFYILFFFSTLVSFANFAAPKKDNALKIQLVQCAPTLKKSIFKLHFGNNLESLQKDLIDHTLAKIRLDLLIVVLIALPFFFYLKIDELVLSRPRYKYWFLLKMLYPKHVFW